ncbi:hypothetical protein PMZ80_000235 [Knufia obscura]|uniref:Zn(2)-C6 fungal-type domain-containing protein n=1 Tax=Knufia obscura TaxID=1635080 RepID=A0ABR0RZR0_9EURO|nr:hypothetical protein PMZ80_000235 [Knufia obscura]
MSTPARRTRTGCKTCRQRKLKCDETKPVCGQCRKSNRECLASEGISFRHAQNAGFSGEEGGSDLSSFYKYRQKFNNTYFLPVPKELSFVHISDPYADEPQPQPPAQPQQPQQQQAQFPPQPASPQYVDVAATSLKAMIDPNLEQSTSAADQETVHPELREGAPPIEGDDTADTDHLNEAIRQALQNANEPVKDEFGTAS